MLQIKKVVKSFDDLNVLNRVDWDIQPGKIYGLIGKNGAGKSTLLRSIACVYNIDEGEILYFNQPIHNKQTAHQDIVLISDYPFELKTTNLHELSKFYKIFYPHFDENIFQDLISLFDFDPTRPIHKLSKGLKRQSSLIIALSLKPKLLLMDESYDGLDPYIRLDLTNYLKQHFISENHTIIISSHNIHELEHLCDELVILDDGQLHQQSSLIPDNDRFIKVQVGFNYDIEPKKISELKPLDTHLEGRVYTLILEEEYDVFKQRIKDYHPALVHQLYLPIQELYLKKLEAKSYEKNLYSK